MKNLYRRRRFSKKKFVLITKNNSMRFTTIYFWTEGNKQHLNIVNGYQTYSEAKGELEKIISLEPSFPGVLEFREQPQPWESLFIKYEDGRIGKIVGYGDK